MRAYDALLRLATIETDARSRAVAEALDAQAAAEAALKHHDAMVLSERQAAEASPEALSAFGSFYVRANRDRARLQAALKIRGDAVAQAREALTLAMTEQRKMERLIELEQEREALTQAHRERLALDEAATLRHAQARRSQAGSSKPG